MGESRELPFVHTEAGNAKPSQDVHGSQSALSLYLGASQSQKLHNSFPKNHLEDMPELFHPPKKVGISQGRESMTTSASKL